MSYQVGDVITSAATVVQVNDEKGYLRLRLATNTNSSTASCTAIVYKSQLSDIEALNEPLFAHYKRTMRIDAGQPMMIVNTVAESSGSSKKKTNASSNGSLCHYVTFKQTLVGAYGTSVAAAAAAKSFDELRSNEWRAAWTRRVLPNGLLVEMPHGLVGFGATKHLGAYTSTTTTNRAVGESLLVRIGTLFADQRRFNVHVRSRHDLVQRSAHDAAFMARTFASYVAGTRVLMTHQQQQQQQQQTINVGAQCQVAVKSFSGAPLNRLECVFVHDLSTRACAFIDDETASGNGAEVVAQMTKPGTRLDALVVAYDPLAAVYCVTVDKRAIKVYMWLYLSNN